MTTFLALCLVSWLVSLLCLVSLWRQRGIGVFRKLGWSVLLVVPVLGPLLYGGLFQIPPVQPEAMQQKFDVTRHVG